MYPNCGELGANEKMQIKKACNCDIYKIVHFSQILIYI